MSWTVWLATSPLAKFADPVPAAMVEAAVLDHFGRPDPGVPVQPRGHRLRVVLAEVAAHLVGHAAGHVELADQPVLELLHPLPDVRAGAVLGADLDHAAVLAGGLDHLPAFPDAPGGRLLDVHVLARLAGPDRLQGVPVVLGGEADRVDRLVVEQLPLVGVGLELQARQIGIGLRGPVELALIAIADRGDLDVVRLFEDRQAADVRPHAPAQADQAHADPLVGAADVQGHGRRRESGDSRRRGRRFQKTASCRHRRTPG